MEREDGAMEREECKVSVWVCREEKLVSGLSRRTTCADVVRALLEDQRSALPARSYCIVEKWRGYERALPARTRLLRLWSAWGREREHVRFVLVRSDASVPSGGARSAEARVVSSAESRERAPERESAPAVTCSRERHRRVVRKAFRKLERMKQTRGGGGGDEEEEEEEEEGKRHASRDRASMSVSAERMETLVHLVVSQDHTIRQQLERISELDGEIERYEARVHLDRIRVHGVNYVQDTYLAESSPERDEEEEAAAAAEEEEEEEEEERVEQFEEYAARWDEVIRLQEELVEREALLERLTGEIEEELNHRWMRRRREELRELKDKDAGSVTEEVPAPPANVPQVETLSDNELQLEEERVKTQLDTSLYIGLRLNTDLEAVKSDLDMSRELWEAKDKELRDLLEKVHSLNEGAEEEVDGGAPVVQSAAEKSAGWVEEARGLSKSCGGGNDDDSDTGLSSMHSQDSDNPPVCESLV